jgi:hypothetical protein
MGTADGAKDIYCPCLGMLTTYRMKQKLFQYPQACLPILDYFNLAQLAIVIFEMALDRLQAMELYDTSMELFLVSL